MTFFISRLTSIFSVLLLLACQTPTPLKPKPTQATPQLRSEFEQGRRSLESGDTKSGLARLKRVTQTGATTELADNAHFLLAQTYEKQGQDQNAEREYNSILNAVTASPLEGKALVGLARLKSKKAAHADVEALYKRAGTTSSLSAIDRAEFDGLYLQSLIALNRKREAVTLAADAAQAAIEPEKSESMKQAALNVLDSVTSAEELSEIASRPTLALVRGKAYFKLGQLALSEKQFGKAKSAFESALQNAADAEFSQQATRYLDQIDARDRVQPKTIGVVLPLTGKQSAIGQKALKGLQLGLGIFGPQPSGLRLAVLDSEGNPEIGKQAIERLIIEDQVIAAVGGLSARTAGNEAQAAAEFGLPLVLLTPKAGLTAIGDSIFRNAVTSAMQADALMLHARERLGLKRLALLFPNDAYGVEFANAVWDSALKNGISVHAAQTYDPKETDFKTTVRKLIGTYYLDDRIEEYRARQRILAQDKKPKRGRGGRIESQDADDILPPIVNFDALVIPDSAKALGQIAPMLAYHDVDKMRLIGPNLWNNAQLVTRGERYVEGSLFVDQTFKGDDRKTLVEFQSVFRSLFGEEPGTIEAQAFETGRVLRHILQKWGASSRSELTERLMDIKDFEGPFGKLTMSQSRELERALIPLTVRNTQIAPANTQP